MILYTLYMDVFPVLSGMKNCITLKVPKIKIVEIRNSVHLKEAVHNEPLDLDLNCLCSVL